MITKWETWNKNHRAVIVIIVSRRIFSCKLCIVLVQIETKNNTFANYNTVLREKKSKRRMCSSKIINFPIRKKIIYRQGNRKRKQWILTVVVILRISESDNKKKYYFEDDRTVYLICFSKKKTVHCFRKYLFTPTFLTLVVSVNTIVIFWLCIWN